MSRERGRPAWFKLFLSLKPTFDAATDEAAGKALKAAFQYFDTEETPDLIDGEPAALLFASMKPYIDESVADYKRSVESGKTGGRKRWSDE